MVKTGSGASAKPAASSAVGQQPDRGDALCEAGRKGDGEHRSQVAEVPVARQTAAEADVVGGDLDDERNDRRGADRCERIASGACDQPSTANEKRDQPEPECDRRQVRQQRGEDVERKRIAVCRRAVRAERTVARRGDAGGESDPRPVQRDEHRMPPRPAVHQDRDRENEREDHQLRTRTDRQHDCDSRQRVVSLRRCRDRDVDRQQRAREQRVGDHVRQQQRGECHPRHDSREHRRDDAGPNGARHTHREHVHRQHSRRHHERVCNMDGVETLADRAMGEERRDQQRIHLVERRHQLVMDMRQRRAQPGDAEREPLVEQLVRHHQPVGNAGRQHGQPRPERKPHDKRDHPLHAPPLIAETGGEQRCRVGMFRQTERSRPRRARGNTPVTVPPYGIAPRSSTQGGRV